MGFVGIRVPFVYKNRSELIIFISLYVFLNFACYVLRTGDFARFI